VTLALAFATKRMTEENLFVRILGSCEMMANASVVCTDKTGTLTQNVMSVVAGSIGIHAKFVRNLKENKARTNAPDQGQDQPQEQDVTDADELQVNRKHADNFSIEQDDINAIPSPQLKRLFNQSITINSTAFEDVDPETKQLTLIGSKTETALLQFAKDLGWENWKETRESAKIVQMIPFSSERKAMGVVVRLPSSCYCLFLKDALETLTKKCARHVVVFKNPGHSQHADSEIGTTALDEITRDNISRTIIFYTNQMLRTIALCYWDFENWPPAGTKFQSADEVSYGDLSRDMTLVAITGTKDPLRIGIREAVATYHHMDVTVKTCARDNVLTARSIATQCGIYTAGGIITEGPVFRALDPQERIEVIPQLQVLVWSSPEDKPLLELFALLARLPALWATARTTVPHSKPPMPGPLQALPVLRPPKRPPTPPSWTTTLLQSRSYHQWGRCINDAVRKPLQFQIPTNITVVVITFVSAVSSNEESVLTAVQLLWINIITDTFAALTLATDPTSKSLLDRKPDTRDERGVKAAHSSIERVIDSRIHSLAK